MKWIEIDEDNLPTNEVLAANFMPGNHGYRDKLVGYISNIKGIIYCESGSEMIGGCTHYIDIHKFDI